MKILLVNPSYRDVYRTFDFVLPPLGLAYMAALLAKKNYDVKIVDLNVGQKDQVIPHNNWDLVGITLDTSRYYKGVEYARMLKSQGARVVVGGPHASFMADEILERGSADYVVRGEGEHTILHCVAYFESRKLTAQMRFEQYVSSARALLPIRLHAELRAAKMYRCGVPVKI